MSEPSENASHDPLGEAPNGTAISSAAFREALSRFASGVTVVAAFDAGVPVGFTATGFSSVSLVPPLVLVCIDRTARVHDPIVAALYFGVSILQECQAALAMRFAQRGVDRFRSVSLKTNGTAGVPLIEGALANLRCRHHAHHPAGDHTILVGEVVDATVAAGEPLLHFARLFGGFAQRSA
jgi:flavin reductase ActVB